MTEPHRGLASQGTVGVALATFNGARFLSAMLDSIERQTLRPDIIAVSDDHSTDETVTIVGNRSDRFDYVLAPNPRKGVVANFEHAMQLCSADYTALADQDDAWRDDKLAVLHAAMAAAEAKFGREMPILVFSDLEIVDGHLNSIAPSFYRSSLKRADAQHLGDFILDGHIPGCAMFMNRALADAVRPFPPVMSHDWWIQIIAAAIGRVVHVDQSLILYRQHGDNTVGLGNFSGGTLRALLLNPIGFLLKRREMARVRAVQVCANIAALLERFDQRLTDSDRHMLSTLLNGGAMAKLRVLDTKRLGIRYADCLLVLRAIALKKKVP